jgi:diaminohydroxyphosphoribosylaminopyrimidine deaminase/5-amino-6-(5-phosphoribosylamino)uracil reductase
MDAIVIGIGTALADDPLLTARPAGPRVATRVVLDSQGRLPLQSQIVQSAQRIPTLLVTGDGTLEEKLAPLRGAGCQILQGDDMPGRLDALLAHLGRRRATNLLVEGGARVLGSFLDAGIINEVHVFIAPKLVGGAQALTPIGGRGMEQIADALGLIDLTVEWVEGDIYLHGWR